MVKAVKLIKNKKIIRINTNATLDEVFESPECPIVLKRALRINTWHERNETSVESSLLSSGLNPYWISVLLALDVLGQMKDGKEEKLSKIIHHEVNRGKLECLTLLMDVPGRRIGEALVSMTPADRPIVSAVASVEIINGKVKQAILVLTGVWQENFGIAKATKQLIGTILQENVIKKVAEDVEKEVKPKGNYRGSVEYRRAMAGVLSRRALEKCK